MELLYGILTEALRLVLRMRGQQARSFLSVPNSRHGEHSSWHRLSSENKHSKPPGLYLQEMPLLTYFLVEVRIQVPLEIFCKFSPGPRRQGSQKSRI